MAQRRIKCPKCGATGIWLLDLAASVNDNEDFTCFEAPEGFRKVQLGWNGSGIYLVCVKCGVPGHRADILSVPLS